jgi:hypothetical protein
MALEVEVRPETSPKVYSVDDTHLFLNWIAEGTDGYLYTVPSAPGGWRLRHKYEGPGAELKAVSPQKARAITQFVGGTCKDWGTVTIAEGSPETTEYWVAPRSDLQTVG